MDLQPIIYTALALFGTLLTTILIFSYIAYKVRIRKSKAAARTRMNTVQNNNGVQYTNIKAPVSKPAPKINVIRKSEIIAKNEAARREYLERKKYEEERRRRTQIERENAARAAAISEAEYELQRKHKRIVNNKRLTVLNAASTFTSNGF